MKKRVDQIVLSIVLFVFCIARAQAQDADSVVVLYDSLMVDNVGDTLDVDSVVTLHRQEVVKKQVVVEHHQFVDTDYRNTISIDAQLPWFVGSQTTTSFADANTEWHLMSVKQNAFRLVYGRTLHGAFTVGIGASYSQLNYQISYNQRHITLQSTKITKIDTLHTYYIERDGVEVPHYITRTKEYTKVDTLKTTTSIDSACVVSSFGIPFVLQKGIFSNYLCYLSATFCVEPNVIICSRGVMAQNNSITSLSLPENHQLGLNTYFGTKIGLYVTENISIDALLHYRFCVRNTSPLLSDALSKHQFCITLGLSYSF